MEVEVEHVTGDLGGMGVAVAVVAAAAGGGGDVGVDVDVADDGVAAEEAVVVGAVM